MIKTAYQILLSFFVKIDAKAINYRYYIIDQYSWPDNQSWLILIRYTTMREEIKWFGPFKIFNKIRLYPQRKEIDCRSENIFSILSACLLDYAEQQQAT